VVDTPRPAPGEEVNTGPETVPRLAATVILLRGGDEALEVLLAQRSPQARFMGGAWVFPGGAVSPEDGEGEPGRKAAAIRELSEETGVGLDDPDALVAYSRWITPAVVKIRYDT
jgi:8-oxo-dGTP pyrophosphatase MutT (NUDIX family)